MGVEDGKGGVGKPVAKMVTLGRLPFIWVKFRPLEFVKTKGLVCRGYTTGEADPTAARA